jgi:uncharacterized repeat protein (TIGR03803 family)
MSRGFRSQLFQIMLPVLTAAFVLVPAATAFAHEYKLHILHAFCSEANCRDGKWGAGLVSDADDNLFGATPFGGANSEGTIFELSRTPDGKRWSYQVLHDFCARARCHDGSIVLGPLVVASNGALYGITNVGGRKDNFYGVIFSLTPNADRTVWTYQVLIEMCPEAGANCESISSINYGLTYAGASTGALYDGVSPLYGASLNGGVGPGTVFSVTPPQSGRSKWHFKVIYDFCSQTECGGGGALPGANVVVDAAGNLFGTTTAGGANGAGVLFELQQKHGAWTETVLHDLCAQPGCADEHESEALIQGPAGTLIGTVGSNPKSCAVASECGLLFQFEPGADWKEHILHRFCRKADCRDGSWSYGLTLAPSGDLIGVTSYGGGHDIDQFGKGGGTIFRLGSSFDVLRRFCSRPDCVDGEYPDPSIVVDSAGNVFGTAGEGGPHGAGEVFELTP